VTRLGMLRRSERGLSLVETLAAILVFSIVTIGIVPLLASSMQGTALARSYTVGKEVARQAMERVRGLPFYISFDTLSQKVDVLDMYFPCANPEMTGTACESGGTGTYWNEAATEEDNRGVFQVVCQAQGTDACAVDIPEGYTLTFRTLFVESNGTTPSFPENDYAWNVVGKDRPPTDMVHMTVSARWNANGRERTFDMHSLVGDRKVGDVKVAGSGRLHYGVQVLTRYRSGLLTGQISDLSAVIGSAESRIESRLVSTATQRFRTADIRLIAQTEPVATDLGERIGALGTWRAPPAFAATTGLPFAVGGGEMDHPNLPGQQVARLDRTEINSVEVDVAEEEPVAKGQFSFTTQPESVGYVTVQAQKPENLTDVLLNPLRLDWNNRRTFSLARVGGQQFRGGTNAVTGELGTANRRVQTGAKIDHIREIRLFPTSYVAPGESPGREIVKIQDFQASVDCNAKSTLAGSSASAAWSATIRHWDRNTNKYPDPIPVSGAANGGGDLQAVLGGNVLLHSSPPLDPRPDLWLFDEPEENRVGYFTSFSFGSPTVSKAVTAQGGTFASANVNDAITITTVPPNPEFEESALVISVGNLSCTAMDNR
jgi:type II secretory pathway pseudopilin PulG